MLPNNATCNRRFETVNNMSDESCYYSPGEMPDDDEKENKNASEDPLFRNLMSDFQNEMKTNGHKPSSSREPMKVFLRIRPFSSDEMKASESQGCLKLVDDKTVLLQAPQDSFTFKSSIRGIAEQTHQFSFSKVYDQDTTQKDIFDDSILGYVKDFLDGINCLVFTYGITNSGKTFTIQGNPKNGGILPRTLDVLFNSIKGKQYEHIDLKPIMYQDVTKLSKEKQKYEEMLKKAVTNAGQKDNLDLSLLWKMETTSQSDASTISVSSSSSSTYITANDADYSSISDEVKERVSDGTVLDTQSQGPVRFSIWVSFAEIYNEYIYDLLDPTPSGKGKKRPVLKLGDDKKGNPYVKGLKEIQVNSADEAFTVVRVGQKNQNIAATKLNQNSSRSHSIFTIKILRVVDVEEPQVVRISRLSFVDLAGSERHNKTQSTGNRLKEASNINTSIMTLGKCIEYLRYNQQHKNHPLIVPFRETKLTRLFQGFFLGKGKAAMIVNISQCASVFDETYNVLKFSAIAKQVKTNGARNTELFKPKQLPKPSLSTATPLNGNKSHWVSMGLTTPKPVQKAILYESMCDDDQYRALISGYEELRKQLLDERRKNALMELKVREEVCAEMSEQLVEIERDYSARLQEEQQTMEEQCERRIEMLTKSMKKSRKRKKIDRTEDEDDSYVSSILFHAEKVKVKERDETIRSLRAKLAEKEMAHELYKQAHTPDQHPIAIKNLQSDLDEAHETLNLHETHIDELQTKLNTAQDYLEEKDVEIEKLKETIDTFEECSNSKEIIQLRDLLQKTTTALDEARQKLDQRDDKLKMKDEEITRLQNEVANITGSYSRRKGTIV